MGGVGGGKGWGMIRRGGAEGGTYNYSTKLGGCQRKNYHKRTQFKQTIDGQISQVNCVILSVKNIFNENMVINIK